MAAARRMWLDADQVEQLARAGNKVRVEVCLEHVNDAEAAGVRLSEIAVNAPVGIDEYRRALRNLYEIGAVTETFVDKRDHLHADTLAFCLLSVTAARTPEAAVSAATT